METIVSQMLKRYNATTTGEMKNALKEVLQELILYILSKSDFFNYAAFYGGTALRIFYNLDRFSEDLDFSLKYPNKNFDLKHYIELIQKELTAFGISVIAEVKTKSKDSHILSAFLKSNTQEHIITLYSPSSIHGIHADELLKIKIEVDTDPPKNALFENHYRLLPAPFDVCVFDIASLFAGKIHAILCRTWKNRIKGRDLYDFIFFLSINAPVNLSHLKSRLVQTNYIAENDLFTLPILKEMLIKKFSDIDYKQAKEDVKPFIKDVFSLSLWSNDFFIKLLNQLKDK